MSATAVQATKQKRIIWRLFEILASSSVIQRGQNPSLRWPNIFQHIVFPSELLRVQIKHNPRGIEEVEKKKRGIKGESKKHTQLGTKAKRWSLLKDKKKGIRHCASNKRKFC